MGKKKEPPEAIKTRASIARLARAAKTRTNLSEIAQEIINSHGGARGFAKEYKTTYDECDKAPTQRVALLKMAANLIQVDSELNGNTTELDALIDDVDIDREATELLNEIQAADRDNEP